MEISNRGQLTQVSTNDGSTALLLAVEGDHTDCVRLLLECGANIEAKNNVRKSICAFEYEQLCISVLYHSYQNTYICVNLYSGL